MEISDSYSELKQNRFLKILFLIIFASVIGGILYIFRFYFWPFFWALIFYFALFPVHNYILKYVKRRSLSSTILIILLLILVLAPLFYLMVVAANQSYQLYLYFEKSFNTVGFELWKESELVKGFLGMVNITEGELVGKAAKFIEEKSFGVFTSVTVIIAYPVTFSINLVFMLIMLFFLLNKGYMLSSLFYRFLPFPEDIEKEVVNRLKEVIKVLLAGNTLIMILQGIMVGIALFAAGIPMGLLGGIIAAILSLIPVVGTGFIWIPAAVYLWLQGSYSLAIVLPVWCFGWYLVLENLLKPVVLGEKLNFHPILFFFLLLGSIQAFGLPGVIIGPLLLTLFYSLLQIYEVINSIEPPAPGISEKMNI